MKKKLITLTLLAGMLFSLNACKKEKSELEFTTGIVLKSISDDIDNTAMVTATYTDWLTFREGRDYLTDLDEKYNEDYFNDKALFIYVTIEPQSISELEITNIYRDGDCLEVNIDIKHGDAYVVTKGMVIAELAKKDVKGIKCYTLHKTNPLAWIIYDQKRCITSAPFLY
ncbi:MAG: hypothetical protein BWY30_00650 [Tenericutes bacterium ADurb.Bin239]|jgi:hypothetical protein|nr:MAG: hypothetical protein BWY30_00650 [Tenericutes bacterium ADurb.Bin239]